MEARISIMVASFRGVRFLLEVCYDLRFPVWSRNRGDYDAILYVASWPTPRVEAWKALLRARAIENQCYVIAVNRTGKDPYCDYCGCGMYRRVRGMCRSGDRYGGVGSVPQEVSRIGRCGWLFFHHGLHRLKNI